MREVEASRFVTATLPELERALSPSDVIEHEGTFTVAEVTETDDAQRVTARAGGMEVTFVVEERDDGYYYAQLGDQGPFESMATTVTFARRNEGTDVTMRSTVSLGLPLSALTDRIAAWKRRGELERALDNVAAAVE